MRLAPTVKLADALTSACSVGATNPEVAAAALASVWGVMASPAKVSMLALQTKYLFTFDLVNVFLLLLMFYKTSEASSFFMRITFSLLWFVSDEKGYSVIQIRFRADHKSKVEMHIVFFFFFLNQQRKVNALHFAALSSLKMTCHKQRQCIFPLIPADKDKDERLTRLLCFRMMVCC